MAVTWIYPWSILGAGATTPIEALTPVVDGVNLATHYHSIRTLDPQRDDTLFESYPAGCYFDPSPEHFADTPIEPSVNVVGDSRDALGDIVSRAAETGLAVNAWFVCNHNSRLGTENPRYRFESAFGTPHDHALCPSYPEVREYFAGVARSLGEYDIDGIQLESLGFPNAVHGHGGQFGHDKNHALNGPTQEVLLSQCFCDGCRSTAADHPVDMDHAETVVQSTCRELLADPASRLDLTDLRASNPVVDDLFDFRAAVVEALVSTIDEASRRIPLNYYVADGLGHNPDDGWPAGVDLPRLEPYLDRVTALCYVGDAAEARNRVEDLGETVDIPVDAGVCVDPNVVESKAEWVAVVDAVQPHCDEVHVYNQTLFTDAHVDWLAETFA